MSDLKIQLVFQGGGAKLVALIAAAQAVYDVRTTLNITRISGTSAGALAGCMLATGKDPELFRQATLRLAKFYLPQIEKPISTVKSLFDVFRGVPLYYTQPYRRFLRELFYSVANVQHMNELKIPCLFHATDIRNGAAKRFDGSQADHTIEEALYCSSALPFIFETYHGSPYIDGGLINNFPSDDLLAHKDSGDVVGFGFKKHGTYNFTQSAFEYSKALIFSAMDVAVEKSLDKLPPAHVKYIETDIDTLDFEKALGQLENPVSYNNYKTQANIFLGSFMMQKRLEEEQYKSVAGEERKSLKLLEQENSQKLRLISSTFESIIKYHSHVLDAGKFRILKKSIIGTCNGLLHRDSSIADEITVRDVIQPIESSVSAYGATLVANNRLIDVGELHPRITKMRNGKFEDTVTEYEVIPLRFPVDEKSDSIGLNREAELIKFNLMFSFIHHYFMEKIYHMK